MSLLVLLKNGFATNQRPEILIPDNAKTFQSREMHEFCNSTGIFLSFPAERESWAHGNCRVSSQGREDDSVRNPN